MKHYIFTLMIVIICYSCSSLNYEDAEAPLSLCRAITVDSKYYQDFINSTNQGVITEKLIVEYKIIENITTPTKWFMDVTLIGGRYDRYRIRYYPDMKDYDIYQVGDTITW